MPVTPFPRPKSMSTTTGSGPAADATVRVVLDASIPAQGFRLQTSADGITVTHADAAGLRYALATLDQLRADRGFATTSYDISDHPDFGVRGFMLDVSRDRVPTRRTLARWVEVLELARINSFELYTEHTYAFSGQQVVWQDASPLTAADLQWLDALCASKGIDLVCNQNTLGHMERFLKHPEHAGRAENEDGFTMRGHHRPPSTVEPTPENAAFVQGLLEDVAPNFRTKRINIGADEPFELGTGKSAQRIAEVGIGTVYFEYVTSIMQPWLDRGYTVEFWADVFGDHPELMDRVPPGAIPVVWQYDSPALLAEVVDAASPGQVQEWRSLGVDVTALRDGFRDRAKLLLEAGIPFWVAPGASNWNSLLGRWDNAVANMVDAAEVGLENGAQGYLNTSWGDHGHWDPPSVAFGPVLFGGAVSWSLEDNRDVDVAAVLSQALLLDPTGITGEVLIRAGKVCQQLGAPLLNSSPLCLALREPDDLKPWAVPSADALAAVHETLLACLADLPAAEPAAADGDVVLRELAQALRLSDLAVRVLQARAEDGSFEPAAAARLLTELDALLEEQRACWLLRSRPGGLADSVAEFGRLRHALLRAGS
ncbi:family 20 glycosylhydrolase [Kineococcus sp. SYSU DK003]|uniref:family 20 glycosylhydrolase n=1 Tax=Kineococcus sp. SYSU DK003 TaxID=3383124 RepID=UPI003D7DF4C8